MLSLSLWNFLVSEYELAQESISFASGSTLNLRCIQGVYWFKCGFRFLRSYASRPHPSIHGTCVHGYRLILNTHWSSVLGLEINVNCMLLYIVTRLDPCIYLAKPSYRFETNAVFFGSVEGKKYFFKTIHAHVYSSSTLQDGLTVIYDCNTTSGLTAKKSNGHTLTLRGRWTPSLRV
ncbi:hypothetical protein BC835DRAFT_618452 [Cytidiella melzeri]|nr:hypothetical protein BC835DRAFT_618452 [Cytidiella melzeri]